MEKKELVSTLSLLRDKRNFILVEDMMLMRLRADIITKLEDSFETRNKNISTKLFKKSEYVVILQYHLHYIKKRLRENAIALTHTKRTIKYLTDNNSRNVVKN